MEQPGRALYLRLEPFTRRERTGRLDESPFHVRFLERPELPERETVEPLRDEEVFVGGMPPVALGGTRLRDRWFFGYEQTYLARDERDLSQVADLVTSYNVLHLSAQPHFGVLTGTARVVYIL